MFRSLALLFTAVSFSTAANLYWGGNVNGSFQTLGNWWADVDRNSAASSLPGATDIAIFNAGLPVPFQINSLGGAVSLQGLVFNGNASAGITLGSLNDFVLTLGASGISIDSGSAAHFINSAVTVNAVQTWSNQSSQTFTQAGNVTLSQNLTLSGPGHFAFTGSISSLSNRLLNLSGTGTTTFQDLAISSNSLTLNVADGLVSTINGVVSGGGSLHKDGLGTLILAGANTFTGTLRLLEGDVQVQKSNTANTQVIFGQASGAAGSNGFGRLILDNSTEDVNYRVGTLYVHPTSTGGVITSAGGAFGATLSLNGNRTFIVNEAGIINDLVVTVGIVNGDATARSLTKQSIGTMVMQGANTYTGSTFVDRGLLVLDYSLVNGDSKLSNSSATTLRGGALELRSNGTAATTEVTSSLSITNGSNRLTLTSVNGQDLTFSLTGGISRSANAGVLDIQSNDFSKTTISVGGGSSNNAEGFLGGWATVGGSRWATRNGADEIVALAGTEQNDLSQWTSGDNIIVTGPVSGTLTAPAIASLILDHPAGGTLAINNNTSTLLLTSGALMNSQNVTAGTTITGGQLLTQNSLANATNELIITNHSAQALTLDINLGGNNTPQSSTQNVTLAGSGLIELAGNNSYSGNLYIQGNVRASGGNAISDYRNTVLATGGDMTDNGARLDLNGGREGVGNLSGGGNADNTYRTVGPGEIALGTNGDLILNQNANTTFYGIFTGSGLITKRGDRTLTLSTNPHSFSGELLVQGGALSITGGGDGFTSLSRLRLRGGAFSIVQNQTGTLNKMNNSAAVILEGTSSTGLSLSATSNGARTETVGTLTLAGGSNTITLDNSVVPSASNNAATTTLAFGSGNPSFARINGSTLLLRGINLAGTASASTVATRLTFSNTTAINAALVGTTTSTVQTSSVTNLKLLPFAIGENNLSGAGSSFLTYATTIGLRPLADTEYASDYAAAAADANLSLNASASGLAGKTLNALRLVNSTGSSALNVTGSGNLVLTSGGLLFTAGATDNDATLSGFTQIQAGTSAAGADELVVFVTSSNAAAENASLTLSPAIVDNGGATSLTKSGAGTLILGGANTYTGSTTINEGVLQFGQSTGTLGTGSVRMAGGTLRWAAGNTTDITAGGRIVELLGTSAYLAPGAAGLTSAGGSILNAGSVFDTGANNVTLAGAIGNSGYGGLTKTGTGTLTLSTAPTYTGTTLVREGVMNFQSIAPNTMEGLYLAGIFGTMSSTVQNGLNVQQLIVGGAYGSTGANTIGVTATLTVNGGAVNIGSGEGDDFLLIGYRDTSAGVSTGNTSGTADFTAASSVTINVSTLELGTLQGQVTSPNSRTTTGSLLLSATGPNAITAGRITLGNSPASVVNSGAASTIQLGAGSNIIHTDTFVIGGMRSAGNVTLGAGGSLVLRGQQGGSTGTNLFIGDNDSNGSTGTNNVSALTLTGASALDLKINLLVIGRVSTANPTGGYGRGTLAFDTGLIEATTIRLADANYSSGTDNNITNTWGIITQGGDSTFSYGELSQGKGVATWNWQGGTIQPVSGADQTNQNVTITLNGGGSATDPALRTYQVSTGRTSTFLADAEFAGAGSFIKTGGGELVLEGANTNSGQVYISGGSLSLRGSAAMDDAAWFNIATGASLNVSQRTGASYTSDAVISGTGVINASGGTFTVGSSVGSVSTSGVLKPGASSLLNSAASAGTVGDQTGSLTIQGGLNLAGSATLTDRAVLQAGATNRNAGSSLAAHGNDLTAWVDAIPVDFPTYATGAGSGHDYISISGGLTLNDNGGITILPYNNYEGQFGDVFNFLDWNLVTGLSNLGFDAGPRYRTGMETGYDLSLFQLSTGLQWDTSLFLSQGMLVVVPEPGRATLAVLAVAALLFRRRRRSAACR